MKPVIALVGRPNVGKSTLFNALSRSRDAIVADVPGLTRDRQYGLGKTGSRDYLIIDTGGLSGVEEGIDELMREQTFKAVEEADQVLFLVDARAGLTTSDEVIANEIRRLGKPIQLVVNKIDGIRIDSIAAEFYHLGLGEPLLIAASHRKGVMQMIETVLADYPAEPTTPDDDNKGIHIAVVGRPNVGKSTLVNRLVGEERVLAFDQPGTTRDSILVPFERHGKAYTLIDTAGVRKRGRIKESIEKFSVVKTLDAIERSHVVVLVLDAQEGLTDQDLNLLGLVIDSGRALVIGLNKWDGLSPEQRDYNRKELARRLAFIDYAEIHQISALHGTGVGDVMRSVDLAYAASMRQFNTRQLTDMLETAVFKHAPPLVRGRRIKLRYAHQGGTNPPIIVVHGSQTESLPDAYRRYLMNFYLHKLRLRGTPLRMEFKTGDNPYAGKRNKLSERQVNKRRRMMQHVKKKKH